MAAVLKKRVAAEFSQVIQDDENNTAPTLKKLRLVYQPKSSEQVLVLSSSLLSNDAVSSSNTLQMLLELDRSLPLAIEQVQPTITSLLEKFNRENEPVVRAKIIQLLGQLCKSPSVQAYSIFDELMLILNSEKSHIVLAQLVCALLSLGQFHCHHAKLTRQILGIAFKLLNDTSHLVRCKCLELIGYLGSATNSSSAESRTSILSVLSTFSQDPDCRVRAQAFESMLMLHQRGVKLDQSIYSLVCSALTDDHEGVRLTALKLVWVICLLYPEHIIKLADSNDSLVLIDDGFGKICNMVNDISMKVRAEAAALLGSLHQVSPHFLEQTLDKKLMSNMRHKSSAHERQREHFKSGEWSTGQKFADDAPKEDVDPDNVTLISTGACGAFVHGLEDEYLEVRNAAVDSLCELASHSPTFARLSQDFLVDMFNDEIESVRLNAINSLQKICHHFLLREDQLEIILSVLKDFNFDIRDALREMLCCCRVSTEECLSSLVLTLLDNLKRYPEDRQSIWKCMMHLGKRHQSLTLALAPDLLSSHPYFESLEPDVEDPAYVSVLILVFNSAVNSPTMAPLFPAHLVSHYTYLRNTLPDMVPVLPVYDSSISEDINGTPVDASSSVSFLSRTLSRLDGLHSLNHNAAIDMLEIGIRDLHHVQQVEPQLSASAQCITLFLRCQLILDKAFSVLCRPGTLCNVRHESDQQMAVIKQVKQYLLRMEHQYAGIGDIERAQLSQLRLRMAILNTLVILRDGNCASSNDKALACNQFLASLQKVDQTITGAGAQPDALSNLLLINMRLFESCDPVVVQDQLMSIAGRSTFTVLKLGNQLQRVGATIIEPASSSEITLKFTAGLAVHVGVVAVIDNVEHINRLRIQVRYADQQSCLVFPSVSAYRQLSNRRYKLVTKVLLSHRLWSDPCQVQLSVVLVCPVEESLAESTFIELCRPVSVTLSPIPTK